MHRKGQQPCGRGSSRRASGSVDAMFSGASDRPSSPAFHGQPARTAPLDRQCIMARANPDPGGCFSSLLIRRGTAIVPAGDRLSRRLSAPRRDRHTQAEYAQVGTATHTDRRRDATADLQQRTTRTNTHEAEDHPGRGAGHARAGEEPSARAAGRWTLRATRDVDAPGRLDADRPHRRGRRTPDHRRDADRHRGRGGHSGAGRPHQPA